MSSSLPTEAPAVFVCECDKWVRSACTGLPFYKKHEGKQYCVLHYPGKEKSAAFEEALGRKLEAEDFNFRGVWFPDGADFHDFTFAASADFTEATFSADANFHSATFSADANFEFVTFSGKTNFGFATFNADTSFGSATFNAEAFFFCTTFNAETYFDAVKFNNLAYFNGATFSAKMSFRSVKFSTGASFSSATFKDDFKFQGYKENPVFSDKSPLEFHFPKIETSSHLSFHTVTLRPHWFVNVDTRKFEFINVNWDWRDISTKQEIRSIAKDSLSKVDVLLTHRLMAIACRNLAVNAEENHRYEEASRFRYMAMEARRLESRRGFTFWTLGWWYWLASGYGERVWRAFVVLIVIWLAAAALYTQVGFVRWEPRVSNEQEAVEAKRDEVGEPLPWQRALTYSLGVMTLQKPEPRPATNAAQALVMLETILGPVQAALLALAIRRKFMR
ncbi:MAG TPA: pentapeptide repeat-containing protein [Pyrinomonadaceae bacterium]|jgi:hypothetical protein|nr:pentapeptide repeat-containing protein [Pyrinomonadaceae bacterium]